MRPREGKQPQFLIIAGPNGSGKSSAYRETHATIGGRSFRIINPDLFAKRIADLEEVDLGDANLEAVRRIEAWLETSILAGHTVGVETVLSTEKYRRLVERAKQLGYAFQFIYVVLDDPLLNVERVRIRVTRGGHPVPEDKIIERYWRSLKQMPWFLRQADRAWLWNNSGAELQRIGDKVDGRLTLYGNVLPAVQEAAQAADLA